MKMEHRYSKRYPADVLVTVASPPLGIIYARMTNLSCSGIHIDTGSIRLPVGQQVEVFFPLAGGHISSLKALTIHSSDSGTGLYFTHDEAPRAVEAVQHPFYSAA